MYAKFFFFLLVWTSIVFAEPTIGIFTYHVAGSKPWDGDSIKEGITGSEEAVIYMSEQLARLGYKVTVLGNPPDDSKYAATNPRYVKASNERFDIAISWRMPFAAEELKKKASKVYLWPHDTYHAPLSDTQINSFDDVFWLSEWQRAQWVSINPGFKKFIHICGNGIKADQFGPIVERENPYSCIYGSNYARGLEILLDIWPDIKKEFPKATLDIYYGWQHWGLLSPKKELKMRNQVKDLEKLDVKEHGLVSHETLNQAYAKASFWTYPCIAPETFCITALRAQMSGAIPVIIEGTALPETVRYGYKTDTQDHFKQILILALKNSGKISLRERKKMRNFILQEFTWEKVAHKWHKIFEENLNGVLKSS